MCSQFLKTQAGIEIKLPQFPEKWYTSYLMDGFPHDRSSLPPYLKDIEFIHTNNANIPLANTYLK